MSIFQFAKFQRVTVPPAMAGAESVQGIIAEGHAELGAEPRYIIQWPNAEKLGDAGLFTMIVGEVSQGELAKAQPGKASAESGAIVGKLAIHVDTSSIDAALGKVRKLNRLRLPRRKPSRKRTRK